MAPVLVLALALAPALALGCRGRSGPDRAPLEAYRCSCSFLTDWDDQAHAEVALCAAGAERAVELARACAVRAAPGTVERCQCAREAGSPACETETCNVLASQ